MHDWRTGPVIGMVLLVGCSKGATGEPVRALAANLVVQALCGSAYKDELSRERDLRDGTISIRSGCEEMEDRDAIRATLTTREGVVEAVELSGWSYGEHQAALQARVLEAAAPMLDEVGRRSARAAVEHVQTSFTGPAFVELPMPGGRTISGATMVLKQDNPWERWVVLQLRSERSRSDGAGAGTPLMKPHDEPAGFAPLDLGAWEAGCRDDALLGALLGEPVEHAAPEPYAGGVPWFDRWAAGDRWFQCQATTGSKAHLRVQGAWNPLTQRLLRVRIELMGLPVDAMVRVVDRLVATVLLPAQRDPVRAAARDTTWAEEPHASEHEHGLRIESKHDGDTHELVVEGLQP
jgi:hypothetical protein